MTCCRRCTLLNRRFQSSQSAYVTAEIAETSVFNLTRHPLPTMQILPVAGCIVWLPPQKSATYLWHHGCNSGASGHAIPKEIPMLQQRQMAINIVRCTLDQRRSCLRIRLAVPAEVNCPALGLEHQPALIRDISTSGAFFYAKIAPELGSDLTIDFVFPIVERRMKVTCSGKVVRVETSCAGGATGIAMQFQHHDLAVIH